MPKLGDLSLEDRAGQLLWIGFEGTRCTAELLHLIRRVRPGGFVLFGRNIRSPGQVRALTDSLAGALGVPPFIALDQEGGRVDRLRSILGASPSPLRLSALPGAESAVRRGATATALALRSLGFNVNFAPVLDLSGPDPANGIGDRSLGEDPARVARLARIVIAAHLRAGVLPVGKHFPGLGSADADTHLALPTIRTPGRRLWDRDLYPYRRLRALLPMVMVGHAYYPGLQGRRCRPATLSARVVGTLLRQRIRFGGLVLSDDLEMGAIDGAGDAGRVALECLAAGVDGVMFCRSPEKALRAHTAIVHAVVSGEIAPARLRASLGRILALKNRSLGRRARLSSRSLSRARSVLRKLGAPAEVGPDPTARP
ncbi:MAG: glycoside hydrolase family 3 N-terminal domain-containing protein [Acidobacteriota bacterium]